MNVEIPQDWLPEIVEVNISCDLVEELRLIQTRLFRRIAAVRTQYGMKAPQVRFRDAPWLASRTYLVSLHGVHFAWRTLERVQDLEEELARVLADVWRENHDGLEWLVEWQAAVTSITEIS